MACNGGCGGSILNQIGNGLKKLSNNLNSGSPDQIQMQGQTHILVPVQSVSTSDANVYGNPVARISSNGTNAKNQNR